MSVVNCKKKILQENGYTDFQDWKSKPNNVYIGRNMSFYIKGATASKWANPYTVKKYGLDECLRLYEEHINNSGLINDIDELKNKNLGCWCKPNKCHGDILLKILSHKDKN